MKIITMERRTLDGEPVEYGIDENNEDYRDWFCVIETKEEELFYDRYVLGNKGLAGETNAERIWNEMVKHAGQGMGVKWGDDDIYAYIRPDEYEPEINEDYEDGDGDVWVRVE